METTVSKISVPCVDMNDYFLIMIRSQIKNCGYSQASLSEKVGCSRISINRYLNGHCNIGLDVFFKICDVLAIPLTSSQMTR